jgi:hypothetical protein
MIHAGIKIMMKQSYLFKLFKNWQPSVKVLPPEEVELLLRFNLGKRLIIVSRKTE